MALGFKIADGYVEVHANYDKNALQRAAQQAADDSGKTYSREFVKSVDRENRTTIPRLASGFEKENTRRRGMWNRAGRSIARHIRDGLIGPGGAGAAAAGFTRNLIEGITLGQADFGRINTKGFARGAALLGTTVGAGLAVAMIAEIGNAVTAGLPLLLGGAFAAIPFFTLIRSGMEKEKGKWHTLNNEMGRELDKIVRQWKIFKEEISKPWKPVVFATLGGLVQLMKDLGKPMRDIGKAIAPAFGKLLQGVFDSIEAFVVALKPAMPGIVAGLQEWAKQLPRIATALGDMIAVILKDPKQVATAVKNFSDFFILVTRIVGPVVSWLTQLTDALHGMTSAIVVGGYFAKKLQDAWANVKPVIDKVIGWFEEMPGKVKAVVDKVVDWFKGLPGRIKSAIGTIVINPWNVDYDAINRKLDEWITGISTKFDGLSQTVIDWVKDMWDGVNEETDKGTGETDTDTRTLTEKIIEYFKNLNTDVDWEVKDLTDKIIQYFKDMNPTVVTTVKDMWKDVTDSFTIRSLDVVELIKTMASDVWGAVKKMWKDVGDSFVGGVIKSGGEVGRLVDTVVGFFTELDAKVTRSVAKFRDKIVGFFTDLDNKVTRKVAELRDAVVGFFTDLDAKVTRKVAGFRDKIVNFFRDLKNRVVDWVKRMWSEASSSFQQRISELQTRVSRFRDQIVNTFLNLKTRVENTWKTFWTNMKNHGRDAIHSIQSVIGSTLDAINRGFARAVATIGKTWDKIRAAAKKPVKWIFDYVLNGGVIKAFNWIADKVAPSLHIDGFPTPPGYASGGVLPGYTPGRDVHRFHSATGGVLDLSGGEGIARPELVRQVGTDRWDAANAAAAHGRLTEAQGYLGGFAQGSSGGFLGGQRPVPPGWTHQHSGYGWARWAGDLQASMNTAVRAWNAGTIASVRSLSGSYGRHIIENVGGQSVYYAHLARAIVKAGQKVNQGQLIGYSDSTGNSTGPHLHFEIRGGSTALGGTAGGGGGTSLDSSKSLGLISSVLGKLGAIKDTPWGRIVAAAATKIVGSVKEKISSMASSFVGAAGAAAAPLNVTGNKAIVKAVAQATHGWGTGANWNSLYNLVMGESGFRNTAQNPTSSAYGLFQFLNSTWGTVGGHKTSDPRLQSIYGMRYIANSYGNPVNAYSKWQSRSPHWYDQGGVLPKGLSLAYNGTGRNEQLAVLPNAALQHASATGQAHGRAFSPTINVTVQAGLNPVDAGARRALVKALWLELDRYEKDYVR